ncbi:MAG: Fic family protein [Candidatus Methylomirabilales bacterium]
MKSFNPKRLAEVRVPLGVSWLLGTVMESKGRQDLYEKQSPEVLRTLRQLAIVESTESSNRIEGVTVEAGRLRPLVLGRARPRDRPEEEIVGYRNALNWIHTDPGAISVTPETIQRLHAIAQAGAGDAGHWKARDNEIIEVLPDGRRVIRFRPVPARETPVAIKQLCLGYRHASDQDLLPPLLVVANIVLDFLCIHPFRDGNGRVSRLLTLLLLYHHGFRVARYVSLERLIEDSKESYYEALQRSSEGWHGAQHDLVPWWSFFLGILRSAYREFEERVGAIRAPRGAKTETVHRAILAFPGEFAISDVERACPGVSRDMIRLVLRALQKEKQIVCLGRGRSARWRRMG